MPRAACFCLAVTDCGTENESKWLWLLSQHRTDYSLKQMHPWPQSAICSKLEPTVLAQMCCVIEMFFLLPRISHERAFGQVVNGGSAEQNEGGFSGNVAHVGRAHISLTMLPNETEPKTRRFYADLNPEQERVLPKKANHFLFAKLGYKSREIELTNKLFQQLVDLVATAWKDRNQALKAWGIKGCEEPLTLCKSRHWSRRLPQRRLRPQRPQRRTKAADLACPCRRSASK